MQQSLMRIVQEALANVHRHAKATKVDITITASKKEFRLEIRDNGQGMIAPSSLRRCRPVFGTGLRSMQGRLEEMGGRLKIISAQKGGRQGTILRATIPYTFAIKQKWPAGARKRPLMAVLVTHSAFHGKIS
jgi:two-component system, NarL family, sensor kinase